MKAILYFIVSLPQKDVKLWFADIFHGELSDLVWVASVGALTYLNPKASTKVFIGLSG
jgi:hypothetical protein